MNQSFLPRPGFWALAAREKKARYPLFLEMLRFMLVYLIASSIQGILTGVPMSVWLILKIRQEETVSVSGLSGLVDTIYEMTDDMPDWLTIFSLFTALALAGASIFFCRKIERRSLASMGIVKKDAFSEYGIGLICGAVLFTGAALIGSAAGGFQIGAAVTDSRSLLLLVLALLGCLAYGFGIEVMLRGYLAPTMSCGTPVIIPVVVSTVSAILLSSYSFFSGGLGVINVLLLNFMLCLCTMKRGSLWCACGLHGAWLFAGNFLFGFGTAEEPASLCLFPVRTMNLSALLTGGSNGPEASLCATIVLLAALMLFFTLKPKDPAPQDFLPPMTPPPGGPEF